MSTKKQASTPVSLKLPIVIKKDNISTIIGRNKIKILNGKATIVGKLLLNDIPKLLKASTQRPQDSIDYQEDIIYAAADGGFFKGNYRNIRIVNKVKLSTNESYTSVGYTDSIGKRIEKTSTNITKLIGQVNYNTLFSTLCSVINQEQKIKGILAMLTVEDKCMPISSKPTAKTDSLPCRSCSKQHVKIYNVINQSNKQLTTLSPVHKEQKVIKTANVSCQTNESLIANRKPRRKGRRQKPYVIQDLPSDCNVSMKKVHVVHPRDFPLLLRDTESDQANKTKGKAVSVKTESLPELGELPFLNEDSFDSLGTIRSSEIPPELVTNPFKFLSSNIEQHTKAVEPARLSTMDDAQMVVIAKPESPFNLTSKDTLTDALKRDVSRHQAYTDYNSCLTVDDDGNMPIHRAVQDNDIAVLSRQCLVLKMRNVSVDIQANGMTPLLMSVYQEGNVLSTKLLLLFGADPLETADEDKTCLHLAAELSTDHLSAILMHCKRSARKILENNEELWKPEYENTSDEELGQLLLDTMCKMSDSQGYTPLMLASKLGHHGHARALCQASPTSVNRRMPTSGDTALYHAVSAACYVAAEQTKSKAVSRFGDTIEELLLHGADPHIQNDSGSNVFILLTDFQIPELSVIITNSQTKLKLNELQDVASYMLIKDKGVINFKELKETKSTRKRKAKPRVIQNVLIKKRDAKVVTVKTEPLSPKTPKPEPESPKSEPESSKSEPESPKLEAKSINKEIPKRHFAIVDFPNKQIEAPKRKRKIPLTSNQSLKRVSIEKRPT